MSRPFRTKKGKALLKSKAFLRLRRMKRRLHYSRRRSQFGGAIENKRVVKE